MPQIVVTAPTTPWTPPADWNQYDNRVEIVGSGGAGGLSWMSNPGGVGDVQGGGGGGGGAYAIATNIGTDAPVSITWAGNGGVVSFGGYCEAQSGVDANGVNGGAGGGFYAPAGYPGGAGADGVVNVLDETGVGGYISLGSGGGGSGGPDGPGSPGGGSYVSGDIWSGTGGAADNGNTPATIGGGTRGANGTQWGSVGCGGGSPGGLEVPAPAGWYVGGNYGGGGGGGGAEYNGEPIAGGPESPALIVINYTSYVPKIDMIMFLV